MIPSRENETQDHIRKIIHIDMDAFYASVEQRDDDKLRNVPVIVGGKPQSRGVVAACSYEARAFGIHSAMPSYKAHKLCPQAIFVRPNLEKYKRVSQQVHSIFKRYTTIIEPLSLDEAYLDVSAHKEFASVIASEIREQIWQELSLRASAGISYNKFIAKIASAYHKPNGQTVIPPENGPLFVAALPIDDFYGIGKKTATKLNDLGIMTGTDLKKLSLAELSDLFGVKAEYFYNAVRGIDHRPVMPHSVRKSWGREITLSQNVNKLDHINMHLESLAQRIATSLQQHGIAGRCITVKLKYSDFTLRSKSHTQGYYLNDFNEISRLALELMQSFYVHGAEVRLIGLSVSRLNTEPLESLPLFEDMEL